MRLFMNRAYVFRLYPNAEQRVMLAKTFGCVRFIYNKMLQDRIDYYKKTGKSLNNTPAQYKSEFIWLKEVDSLALANAQLNLNRAYKNFFSRPNSGFPKFKSKKKHRFSYSTNNQSGSVRIENGCIRLPKVGYVKLKQHREILPNSTIKTVTVRQNPSGKYYVSILVEYDNQILPIIPHKFVGLDFSMPELYVDSEGNCPKYPSPYRKAEKQLARLQRKFSRTRNTSNNHQKLRIRVARLHEHIANQRKDFLHKKSAELAMKYDVVGIEDLNMKNMARTLHFGKSVADNGWGMFTNMLSYKLAWQGKQLIKIDKWFPSSQLCHVCGYQNKNTKNLNIREWGCPHCGTYHNRDVNAAINIREEAYRRNYGNISLYETM